MSLNGLMAVILRYFAESINFGSQLCQTNIIKLRQTLSAIKI